MPSESEVAGCATKEEWVKLFLRNNPSAHYFEVLTAYNGHDTLGNRLGWFSLGEIRALVESEEEAS